LLIHLQIPTRGKKQGIKRSLINAEKELKVLAKNDDKARKI